MVPDISLGIKVNKAKGELFRRALAELDALDRSKKISSDNTSIYLPALRLDQGIRNRLNEISCFETVEWKFDPETRRISPSSLLGYHPSYEVIGDIAIVEQADAERVGFALLATCKSIRSVITPISDVAGEFRTRKFRKVAGESRTFTVHKEHGLLYRVDLEGAYFSPRLGTERLRVAKQVKSEHVVIDMFAGVGPFALLLAKKGSRVIAIEKNSVAAKYLKENVQLNKLCNVEVFEGDASKLAVRFERQADHVVMNLPHSAYRFLKSAITAAKDGGVIHYYSIAPEEDLYCDIKLIEDGAKQLDANIDVLYRGIVRSYAPRRYNVAIDFKVKKNARISAQPKILYSTNDV